MANSVDKDKRSGIAKGASDDYESLALIVSENPYLRSIVEEKARAVKAKQGKK